MNACIIILKQNQIETVMWKDNQGEKRLQNSIHENLEQTFASVSRFVESAQEMIVVGESSISHDYRLWLLRNNRSLANKLIAVIQADYFAQDKLEAYKKKYFSPSSK
ncbi:hypothetical protein LPTSP4_00450 [Leptospira ryugenii]|uniref:Uncharacterized protein n=1 Tax=Leptospira ryugenii TaxID=1917863 RepID=A0A2P2DV77_9LEPT|nr:hypothetical protein [Leptospira ryugenii]GBF48546.1 hypothetical protein LPTSP4_00450 [Leptospira ryugenii]